MGATAIRFRGVELAARPSGALWWAEARLLCVADLHLGRAERLARRGGSLLPPYDTEETLARLGAEIAELDPRTVVCLGDSFDDIRAAEALSAEARAALGGLLAGRRWFWIAGNHDPGDPGVGGSVAEELVRGPLLFRHIARRAAEPGEVSGHFHPRLAVATRAGRVCRPCFLLDARRMILPAFGTYTGGLDARDPALAPLFGPDARAILTGRATTLLPLSARQSA